MFGGEALATYKPHIAARHLFDMLRSSGYGGQWIELWIERMVFDLKDNVRDRVREHPEVIFVNDHLLRVAAAQARSAHPDHCRSIQEILEIGRDMTFPQYDFIADAVLLLHKQVDGGLTDAEVAAVATQLGRELSARSTWYAARGWAPLHGDVLLDMYADGTLLLEKFRQASLASNDIMSCAQDRSQVTRDNTWAYVNFKRADGVSEQGIAEVQFFVRARVECDNVAVFDDDVLEAAGVDVPVDVDGNHVKVDPVRFAVCKLWLADICSEGTVGCRTVADPETGELPDLFKVPCMSEARNNVRKPDSGASCQACFFGVWLVNVCEFQTQLVPTSEIDEGGKTVRYFMTAHKASGR